MLRLRFGARVAPALLVIASIGCETTDEDVDRSSDALAAVCTDQPHDLAPGAWLCPDEHRAECTAHDGAHISRIYVWDGSAACDELPELQVAPGPFDVGEYEIVVMGDGKTVCIAHLEVVDTVPPTLEPKRIQLWPPNHAMQRITAEECAGATDVCDPNLRVSFLYAASDEPDDGVGDGATVGDIAFVGCDTVDLRSERQGGSNGRIYTLGVRAVDASGNATDGVCRVVVPHDMSGAEPIEDAIGHSVPAPACD